MNSNKGSNRSSKGQTANHAGGPKVANMRISQERPGPSSAVSPGSNSGSNSSSGAGSPAPISYANAAARNATLPNKEEAPPTRDEYFLFAVVCLIGHQVEVTVKNKTVYQGILHAANMDKDFGIVLKLAHKKPADPTKETPLIKTLIIQPQDFVQMVAVDVDFNVGDVNRRGGGFQTDTAISGGTGALQERELQPWTDDSNSGDASLDSASDANSWNTGTWDQFSANEKLFGVRTTFDEDLYTTKLDRNSEDYKRKEKEAQRLANEIMGVQSSNIHLAEERGIEVDTGVDEEDRYGAVVRQGPQQSSHVRTSIANGNNGKENSSIDSALSSPLSSSSSSLPADNNTQGKYVPPSLRKGNVGALVPSPSPAGTAVATASSSSSTSGVASPALSTETERASASPLPPPASSTTAEKEASASETMSAKTNDPAADAPAPTAAAATAPNQSASSTDASDVGDKGDVSAAAAVKAVPVAKSQTIGNPASIVSNLQSLAKSTSKDSRLLSGQKEFTNNLDKDLQNFKKTEKVTVNVQMQHLAQKSQTTRAQRTEEFKNFSKNFRILPLPKNASDTTSVSVSNTVSKEKVDAAKTSAAEPAKANKVAAVSANVEAKSAATTAVAPANAIKETTATPEASTSAVIISDATNKAAASASVITTETGSVIDKAKSAAAPTASAPADSSVASSPIVTSQVASTPTTDTSSNVPTKISTPTTSSKLNANAKEFKPNPNAKPFEPSMPIPAAGKSEPAGKGPVSGTGPMSNRGKDGNYPGHRPPRQGNAYQQQQQQQHHMGRNSVSNTAMHPPMGPMMPAPHGGMMVQMGAPSMAMPPGHGMHMHSSDEFGHMPGMQHMAPMQPFSFAGQHAMARMVPAPNMMVSGPIPNNGMFPQQQFVTPMPFQGSIGYPPQGMGYDGAMMQYSAGMPGSNPVGTMQARPMSNFSRQMNSHPVMMIPGNYDGGFAMSASAGVPPSGSLPMNVIPHPMVPPGAMHSTAGVPIPLPAPTVAPVPGTMPVGPIQPGGHPHIVPGTPSPVVPIPAAVVVPPVVQPVVNQVAATATHPAIVAVTPAEQPAASS